MIHAAKHQEQTRVSVPHQPRVTLQHSREVSDVSVAQQRNQCGTDTLVCALGTTALLLMRAVSAFAVETVRINPAINPPAGTTIHGSAELEVSGTSVVRAVDGKALSTKRISQMDREANVDTTFSR